MVKVEKLGTQSELMHPTPKKKNKEKKKDSEAVADQKISLGATVCEKKKLGGTISKF